MQVPDPAFAAWPVTTSPRSPLDLSVETRPFLTLRTEAPTRLVALDMDGTLLSPGGVVSKANRAALRLARETGVEVAIATGRRHTYAMRQLQGLDLPESTVLISSNGAVVRTLDAALLERFHLARGACERLFRALGEFRNALVVTFDRLTAEGEDECGALVVEELAELHGSIGKWIEANSPYIERVMPVERCLEAGEPIQMMLCGTMERMRRAETLLHRLPGVLAMDAAEPGSAVDPTAEIALHRTEYPARDLSIVDILPAGVSKGTALERLAARRGLSAGETAAVGDNWNDGPMLAAAAVPVLMGNAPAELRAQARRRGWCMAPSNEQDGVAAALDAMLRRNRRLREVDETSVAEGMFVAAR